MRREVDLRLRDGDVRRIKVVRDGTVARIFVFDDDHEVPLVEARLSMGELRHLRGALDGE